ncbi:MAG: carbohydrate ABC transporter permease [Firmicutes bacterium]|nr:carbohydrate ABC transporter permease [Bacillota bacterium]
MKVFSKIRIFDKRTSLEDKIFDVVVLIVLAIVFILVAYPLYFVLIASLSEGSYINRGEVILFPKGFTFESYSLVLRDPRILTGYANTFIYTIFGTLLSVFVTVLAAFPLSRKDMFGHKFFTWFFLFTMYFNGGLIPTYLQAKNLGLVNQRAAVIVIGCLSIWNLIVCRTFFVTNVPDELWEAASIDGCSMYKFFAVIVVPISKTIVAIMVLYYAVGQWNGFWKAMIYLNRSALYPLQLVLRDILLGNQSLMLEGDPEAIAKAIEQGEVMKYAIIVVSSLPVLMFYPHIQKYFVKGVKVGSLKG